MGNFWLGDAEEVTDFPLFQVALLQKPEYLNPNLATGKEFL